MKTIFRYLKKYWLFALSAPLMMMVEVLMDLMLPATMAQIVDRGIASGNLSLVFQMGIRMILYSLIAFAGGSGCSYLASRASTGVGADLRRDLFTKVLSLSHKNLDELETGNLIIRLTNDVTQLEEVTMMILRAMVRTPLQIVGSLIMAIAISTQLSAIFIIFIPLLLIIMTVLIARTYPLFFSVQQKLDRLNTRLQENLAGKRLVKAFVREDYETEKFRRANDDLNDYTVRANRTVSLMNPAMQILLNGGIITALWFGAGLIDTGALKIGALIAFINYLRQLLHSLMMFSHMVMRFSRAQASSERVQEVLQSRPDITEPEDPQAVRSGKGKIEFRNVTFSYDKGGDPVLKDLSFTINPGETVAFLGATGAGKSSLIKLIPRFYDIDSGEILLDGQDIGQLNTKELRKKIAMVPQKTLLFAGTIGENILYDYHKSEQAEKEELMKEAAAKANIAGFIEELPLRYETDVNQRGVNLSGGQKQRIAIARALAKEAPVIILDDATSAVDLATEKRIRSALREGTAQSTVLIIAQRISSIMDADRIIVIEDGKISGMGTHGELLESNGLYREIYESQIDEEAV